MRFVIIVGELELRLKKSVGSLQWVLSRVKNFGNFATWESEARDFRVLFPDNEIGV